MSDSGVLQLLTDLVRSTPIKFLIVLYMKTRRATDIVHKETRRANTQTSQTVTQQIQYRSVTNSVILNRGQKKFFFFWKNYSAMEHYTRR